MCCELEKEVFVCKTCKGRFKAIEGTWLPVYPLRYQNTGIQLINNEDGSIEPRMPGVAVLVFNLREPVLVTSDEFQCYDCLD